ncbi:hypothetical protein K435DRAFT_854184 [Dendrothele bispora CBS 962.96]|uniref:Uncharacterized protein n=1 Tax=Dendrothele bispora (strain CBS 962.96) TaxID=1314807 RepID=A0A4S8MEN2_DENBC|nr:hypothetical protein K435DRAFT_854184 [Dendrothele bispora CBS 962.96]
MSTTFSSIPRDAFPSTGFTTTPTKPFGFGTRILTPSSTNLNPTRHARAHAHTFVKFQLDPSITSSSPKLKLGRSRFGNPKDTMRTGLTDFGENEGESDDDGDDEDPMCLTPSPSPTAAGTNTRKGASRISFGGGIRVSRLGLGLGLDVSAGLSPDARRSNCGEEREREEEFSRRNVEGKEKEKRRGRNVEKISSSARRNRNSRSFRHVVVRL